VVECAGLEIRYTVSPYRGFESLLLRQDLVHTRPPVPTAGKGLEKSRLGGATYHFIDLSPVEALETARRAAKGVDVCIGRGVTTVRDFLHLLARQSFLSVPVNHH
jgi:hypothetical protein